MTRRPLILVLFACLVWYTQSAFIIRAGGGAAAGGGGGPGGVVASVSMPNTTFGTSSASNANAVVGPIFLAMNTPGDTFTGSVSLSGPDVSNFVLTAPTPAPANGCGVSSGTVNCANAVPTPAWYGTNNVAADTYNMPVAQLNINNANITARTYNISLTAGGVTQPIAIALQTTCPTADGSRMTSPTSGCLNGGINGNGTNGIWTFGGLATPGAGDTRFSDGPTNADYTILVNGSPAQTAGTGLVAANGAAVLQLDQGSNVFAMNAGRAWYEQGNHAGFNAFGGFSYAQSPYRITTDGSLATLPHWTFVAHGSGPTNLGLGSVSDPKYPTTSLTVRINSLPTNGTVFLPGGSALTNCPIDPACTFNPPNGVTTLQGLTFQPNHGVRQTASPLTYQVIDPDPTLPPQAAYNYVVVQAAPLAVPLGWTKYVKGGAAITPFTTGLPAPTETGFASNQFTVTIDSLPNNGTVTYSGGGNVALGTLTGGVAALQALNFTATPGNYNSWSKMDYTVTDPNNIAQSGFVEAYVGGGGGGGGGAPGTLWHDPTIGTVTGGGGPYNIVRFPQLTQPSVGGDIVPIRIQNPTASTMAAGYVTLGMPFFDNAVQPSDALVARIGGTSYFVQMDCKVTYGTSNITSNANNSNGSCEHAVLTFKTPTTIAAGDTMDVMIALGAHTGSAAAPSPSAPSRTNITNGTYKVDGGSLSYSVPITLTGDVTATHDCNTILTSPTATPIQWLSGAAVNEFVVYDATFASSKLKITCDIKAYADGTMTTKVIFGNDWFFCPNQAGNGNRCPTGESTTKTNGLNYSVSLKRNATSIYSTTISSHYLYAEWDWDVDSANMIRPNVQFDVPYLEAGPWGIPAYDTSFGVYSGGANASNCYAGGNSLPPQTDGNIGGSGIGYFYNTNPFGLQGTYPQQPMTFKWIDTGFGISGGVGPERGVNTEWQSEWLLSQDDCARKIMHSVMRTSAWVSWHYTDENTNDALNILTYPGIVFGNGFSNCGGTPVFGCVASPGWQQQNVGGDPYNSSSSVTTSHQGDYAYLDYLTSGDWYAIRQMKYAATAQLARGFRCTDYSGFANMAWASDGVPGGPYGCVGFSAGIEDRAVGWSGRGFGYTSLLTPDTDSLKNNFLYYNQTGLMGLYWQYVVDAVNSQYGDLNKGSHGQTRGFRGSAQSDIGNMTFLENYYNGLAFRIAASGSQSNASYFARQYQDYTIGNVSMQFNHEADGFNPYLSTSYHFNMNSGKSWMDGSGYSPFGPPFQRWVDFWADNVVTCIWNPPNSNGCESSSSPNRSQYAYGISPVAGTYAALAHSANAQLFATTGDPDSLRAYLWFELNNPAQIAFLAVADGMCFGDPCNWVNNNQATSIHNIMPRLPDGNFLQESQKVQDFTNNNSITLNALVGQDTELLIFGGGTGNTLNAGSNACDILQAGTGSNTLVAGTGSPFMYGNDHATGLTTFHFGSNSLLCGGKGTYAYVGGRVGGGANKFILDTASSAQQQIDFFNPAKDTLFIKQNLNGSGCGPGGAGGVTCTINAATTDGTNTTLHIGGESVVIWNVANPSSLQATITMTP